MTPKGTSGGYATEVPVLSQYSTPPSGAIIAGVSTPILTPPGWRVCLPGPPTTVDTTLPSSGPAERSVGCIQQGLLVCSFSGEVPDKTLKTVIEPCGFGMRASLSTTCRLGWYYPQQKTVLICLLKSCGPCLAELAPTVRTAGS